MEYPRQLNLQTFEERQETDKWSVELVQKMHTLEKKLEIATKALKKLTRHCDKWELARAALKEMEKIE